MDKKKALLIVAGGRVMPNVLALFLVQPHKVIYLKSEEGWRDEQAFLNIAKELPNYEDIYAIKDVNAYDFENGKNICMEVYLTLPDTEWEWTFDISSAPKITGIAAHEIAKQKEVTCLYIDTQHEKIVFLVKDVDVEVENLFHMSVEDYMKIQHRKAVQYKQDKLQYRAAAEKLGQIARLLALSPEAPSLLKLMRDKPKGVKVPIKSTYLASSFLAQELERLGVLKRESHVEQEITFAFTSSLYAKFVGTGDWLEVYVWDETNKEDFADDCQWGYEIQSTANNELDVVLTYKAQLIFAECKTENEPFYGRTSHLDTVNTKAEMLGRTYVSKMFITNESKTRNGYENFAEQAKLRNIVVLTQEDLPDVGKIMKRESLTPTYPRI